MRCPTPCRGKKTTSLPSRLPMVNLSEGLPKGVFIDTFFKENGKRLLDLTDLVEIANFVLTCHKNKIEAWLAGSITEKQLPVLWNTGVDVICIRGAACISTRRDGRFGEISRQSVKRLVATIKIKQ